VPKFIHKEIIVENVTVVEVEKIVEVPKLVENVTVKEKEVFVDRPKFRERIVDVIKPHYVCQACGEDV
jgi:hypothetical protein